MQVCQALSCSQRTMQVCNVMAGAHRPLYCTGSSTGACKPKLVKCCCMCNTHCSANQMLPHMQMQSSQKRPCSAFLFFMGLCLLLCPLWSTLLKFQAVSTYRGSRHAVSLVDFSFFLSFVLLFSDVFSQVSRSGAYSGSVLSIGKICFPS